MNWNFNFRRDDPGLSESSGRFRIRGKIALVSGRQATASFVAWYGKKRTHLAKREREFLAVLSSGADAARLNEQPEAIGAAHIRALKEKSASYAPSEKNALVLERIVDDIRWWSRIPAGEIIDGDRDPKRVLAMSKVRRKRK